jgi:dyslexia susceptibility 1 candidate gene 1 protein
VSVCLSVCLSLPYFASGNGVDASEEDPQWLKAKGDDFYRGGDFRSALNAYSAALDADENMISCISNRAACYLQLGMLSECKVDCIAALELLEAEPSDGNVVMTIKVLMRRGATNCQLGLFSEALHDYKTAFQKFTECREKSTIVPGITTESLSADVARLEQLVVVDELKKDADVIFGDGRLAEAADKYTEALALIPVHVGCLSNRSACKLAMQDVEGCVDDCTAALDLLQADVAARAAIRPGQSASDNMNMLASILPPAGSEKRKSWVLKTILRRGTAYAQLGRLDEAVDDYRTASGLDPKNETLKSDMNKLVNLREGKRLAQ